MGFDATVLAIKAEKARLVVIAKDVSEKTYENTLFQAQRKNINVVKCSYTIEEIGFAVGKKVGVLAVLDDNFANGLKVDEQNRLEKG